MRYALAKELKDAGFPQGKSLRYFDDDAQPQIRGYGTDTIRPQDRVDVPTLSELIEACGYKFRSLVLFENGDWGASSSVGDENGNTIKEIETTPEEAVGHLYIALQKK